MHDNCIPHAILSQKQEKGADQQTTLDGVVTKSLKPKVFSKDTILHAAAQLVACDDQVRQALEA